MKAFNVTETMPVTEEAVLEQLLRRRHSCRGLLPTPVPEAVIERIIEIAQRTASWCNAQPWQVEITRGEGTEAFRRLMLAHFEDQPVTDFAWPKAYQGVYGDRRRACGFALYESVGVARGDREGYRRQMADNYRFFGASHVASSRRTMGSPPTAPSTAAASLPISSMPRLRSASRRFRRRR
jgi:nitroreductase